MRIPRIDSESWTTSPRNLAQEPWRWTQKLTTFFLSLVSAATARRTDRLNLTPSSYSSWASDARACWTARLPTTPVSWGPVAVANCGTLAFPQPTFHETAVPEDNAAARSPAAATHHRTPAGEFLDLRSVPRRAGGRRLL